MAITIPNNWEPRAYQQDLYDSFGHGKRYQRGVAVWHRRAGKDSTVLNLTARDMFKRVGTYWHMFPEQAQARRAIWNGIDRQGRRILDQFLPPEVRKRESSQEMLIETVNGSTWQMAGSDNYDSLVGSNPVGVVFSEWPLANPEAWEYIRPILVENGGWALFIYTPRGRNHGYTLYQTALSSDDWFCQRLSVDDTGMIQPDQIDAEREAGMSEDKVAQEFYCSFEAANENQMIPSRLVDRARKNEALPQIHDEVVIGVDPARFGDDRSVICIRRGRDAYSIPWEVHREQDTMFLVGRIAYNIDTHKPDAVFVDEGGLGGPIIDRLRQLGYRIIGVDNSRKPDGLTKATVRNKRAEQWQRMKEWLEGPGCALPDNEELEADLTGPLYSYDANNAIQMEKKEDMRKRGVRSPDLGDALALTFAFPVVAGLHEENEPQGERSISGY